MLSYKLILLVIIIAGIASKDADAEVGINRGCQVLVHLEESQQGFVTIVALEVERHPLEIDDVACLELADCAVGKDRLHIRVVRSQGNHLTQALGALELLFTKLQSTLVGCIIRHNYPPYVVYHAAEKTCLPPIIIPWAQPLLRMSRVFVEYYLVLVLHLYAGSMCDIQELMKVACCTLRL
jgi:hypothetical protein